MKNFLSGLEALLVMFINFLLVLVLNGFVIALISFLISFGLFASFGVKISVLGLFFIFSGLIVLILYIKQT